MASPASTFFWIDAHDPSQARSRCHEAATRCSDQGPHRRRSAPLTEDIALGRSLKRRAKAVPACVDRSGTSNGPAEASNGRPEHLCGTAMGFRNLAHYVIRSLLDTGGFRPLLHPRMR